MNPIDDIKKTADAMLSGARMACGSVRRLSIDALERLQQAAELCRVAMGAWKSLHQSESLDYPDDITNLGPLDELRDDESRGDVIEEESCQDAYYRRVTFAGAIGARRCWIVEIDPDVSFNGTSDATTGRIMLRGVR